MAAVGLMPAKRMTDDASSKKYLATLVEFVFAMRDKLKDINENSYNNFMLRVGRVFVIDLIFSVRMIKEKVVTCFYL